MIVANQKGFIKSEYRKFNMKNNTKLFNSADDYGMMNEVFHRRFKKFNDTNFNLNKPDLIIIDGGKGQCNTACKVLSKLKIKDIIVIGIAKGKNRNSGNEKIYFSSFKEYIPKSYHKNNRILQPLIFNKNNAEMYYIQRLRDEAHRFAITAQRKKQKSSLTKSILHNIDGIGPARKKMLILHFGSTKSISEASLSELKKVKGISEKFALKIRSYFE